MGKNAAYGSVSRTALGAASSSMRQRKLDFGASSSQRPSGISKPSGYLRQATITQLAGVVDWRAHSETLHETPSTLYLGHEDVLKLKETLDDASSSRDDLMNVLRRLSAM